VTRAGDATHTAPETGRATAQQRILTVLVLAQLLAGAGLAAGITVGALLAEDLLGGPGLSGLPSALFTGGSALAAIAVGKLSQARGRRPGLAAGFAVGALGAVGIVAATALESLPLLFASFVIYGSGTATNLQARYAGADLATDATRARSLSYVLLGTTAGAVAGPNLVGPTGVVADALGLAPLAGPFLLAAAAYGGAALVISLLLRPDPLLEARRMEIEAAEAALTSSSSSLSSSRPSSSPSPAAEAAATAADSERHAVAPVPTRIWTADVITGVVVMALTQFVMVGLMTMTPVHMRAHDHTVTVVGVVISLHVAAMFLPAPLSGLLVDKFGTRAVAVSAGLVPPWPRRSPRRSSRWH
jgi:MFS family permease